MCECDRDKQAGCPPLHRSRTHTNFIRLHLTRTFPSPSLVLLGTRHEALEPGRPCPCLVMSRRHQTRPHHTTPRHATPHPRTSVCACHSNAPPAARGEGGGSSQSDWGRHAWQNQNPQVLGQPNHKPIFIKQRKQKNCLGLGCRDSGLGLVCACALKR